MKRFLLWTASAASGITALHCAVEAVEMVKWGALNLALADTGIAVVPSLIMWICVRELRHSSTDKALPVGKARPGVKPDTQDDIGWEPQAPAAQAMPVIATLPSVKPGRPGLTFSYASAGGWHTHEGAPFAILDVETTGSSADDGDRIIEVAIMRVDASGRIEDEWATLVNPDRDTGFSLVHHITDEDVADAPRFADIADELLRRLDGAVVVAHNATFDESFLQAELARLGHRGLQAPALCSLWLSRRTLNAPNYRLSTLARTYGAEAVDTHSALGDARMIAHLLPTMLAQHDKLTYGCPTYLHMVGPTSATARPRIVTRVPALRKGEVGWMNTLIDRLPLSGGDVSREASHRYLEMLGTVLEDGKIVAAEAHELAYIAGCAGLGGTQVRALNERFLEGLRDAALADDVLTAEEIRSLTAAAQALGVAGYFDDLTVRKAEPSSDKETLVAAPRPRRCGHCRRPGHNRTRCPELA